MVIVMMDFCYSNLYDFTITRYGIWNSEGARGGIFLHWIRYDGILHSAGDILDIITSSRAWWVTGLGDGTGSSGDSR